MNIKPSYLGKRVSFITSKGQPLDVVFSKKMKKAHLKEIALKWPQWVENETVIDATEEETPKTEKQPKQKPPKSEKE